MRKNLLFVLIALSLVLFSCKDAKKVDAAAPGAVPTAEAAAETAKPATKAQISYAFGVAIGTSLKQTSVKLDYNEFVKGIKDVIDKDKPNITMEQVQQIIEAAIAEGMKIKAAASADKETKFLAENAKKAGVTTTASGLQYEVITMGTGAKPTPANEVSVHYVGTLTDGKTFDSSRDRGEPAIFMLGGVIPGWIEGLQLMPVGSKFKFYIPSKLGYGEQGAGEGIGPNETLIFEVELLSINLPAPPAKK